MNELKITLQEAIKEYYDMIKQSDKLLRNLYEEDISPIEAVKRKIIPKSGTLRKDHQEITYKFHGMGCLLVYPDGIVDFDYSIGTFEVGDIDAWKLLGFIKNSRYSSTELNDRDKLFEKLDNLLSSGYIHHSNSKKAIFTLNEQ